MYIEVNMQSFSIADARSQLPTIIHTVEKGGVTQFTRRGKPVAILLSLKEYETLLLQRKGSLLQAFNAYSSLMQSTTDEILNEEIDSWRDKEIGRKLPWE
jgi:prevent-host-death family protein